MTRKTGVISGCVAAVLVAAFTYWLFVPAKRFTAASTSEACLADFELERGPRLILLPVTVNGRTLSFCVDTGAWKTVFDSSLQAELGPQVGSSAVMTPAGQLTVPLHRCPKASVGPLDLTQVQDIACHDLTQMRYASGKDIYGILGMDFLHKYAIEFDTDEGNCRLWVAAPQSWSKQANAQPLAFDQSNRPYVTITLPGGKPEAFLIDTGANVSTLRDSCFDELAGQGSLVVAGPVSGYAAAGTFYGQIGFVSEIKLDAYSHQGTRLDRDPASALGIRYLSRYRVKLDLPGSKAYFAPGKRFTAAEPIATSGLSVLQVNGEKVVSSVERGGPGAVQRIQPGDVILSVDGRDANSCDMVALHETLTREPGAKVAMQLRRSGQAFNANVELKSRLPLYR
jgi:hypothetical protein